MLRSSNALARGVASFALLAATVACAQEKQLAYKEVTKTYETVKVAEGVYAFIAPEPRTEFVSGNSIAVIGDDGVLVVDTGHVPTLTRKMIAEIRRLTDKPVQYVVNTHWHPDHVMGNSQYKDAFPQVVFVSTVGTREKFETDLRPYEDTKMFEESMQQLRKAHETGKTSDGKPLSEFDKQYLQAALNDFGNALPEFKLARHTPPTLTFESQLNLYLGKREVRVMFLGRGNTGGDAVIYVPDSRVLMTGDLLVNPTPYAFGSFFSEWIETMKKLVAINAVVLVPGHGPVEHDKQYLNLVIELLESTVAQVNAAVAQGLNLEDTRKKINLASFKKQMAGDNKFRQAAFDVGFVAPGVERAYREAKEGKLHDEN